MNQDSIAVVRLSSRQYGQLKYIQDSHRSTIHVQKIMALNQTSLGGLYRRGFVTLTSDKKGVTITSDGRDALLAFENGDFMRKVASLKFSSFIDLRVYENAKLHVVRKSA